MWKLFCLYLLHVRWCLCSLRQQILVDTLLFKTTKVESWTQKRLQALYLIKIWDFTLSNYLPSSAYQHLKSCKVHLYEQQDLPPCPFSCQKRVVNALNGPCCTPCQWTGGDCGYNGLWVMFLLNGSAVALRRLSADTMTRQSSWHLDRQTHTYTGTYIPPSCWQALPNHHWATWLYVGKRMENTHIIVFERHCFHPVCQSGLCNSSLLYH